MTPAQNASRAQIIMLQQLWQLAKGRISAEGANDRERRLNWTERTLKCAVDSWSDLDRKNDVDELKGALLAVIKPADLNAQLRRVRGEHRRLRYVLDGLVHQLGGDSNYIQGVVDQMFPTHEPDPDEPDRWQSERETAVARPRKLLDQLTIPDLKEVIIALRKQTRRRQAEVPF